MASTTAQVSSPPWKWVFLTTVLAIVALAVALTTGIVLGKSESISRQDTATKASAPLTPPSEGLPYEDFLALSRSLQAFRVLTVAGNVEQAMKQFAVNPRDEEMRALVALAAQDPSVKTITDENVGFVPSLSAMRNYSDADEYEREKGFSVRPFGMYVGNRNFTARQIGNAWKFELLKG